MNAKSVFGSFALAALCALGASGCVVRGHAHARFNAPVAVVEYEEEPPPPRVVVVNQRPGYIWIEGRWDRRGGRWVWMDGRYERERVGYRYAPGRWERRGRGHVYVQGRWENGGGGGRSQVRDHRDNRRDNRRNDRDNRGNGPVIRDHRR